MDYVHMCAMCYILPANTKMQPKSKSNSNNGRLVVNIFISDQSSDAYTYIACGAIHDNRNIIIIK